MIYYHCQFFEKIGTDLVHDIISFFQKQGTFFFNSLGFYAEFAWNRKHCEINIKSGEKNNVILRVRGDSESNGKKKAAVEFLAEFKEVLRMPFDIQNFIKKGN